MDIVLFAHRDKREVASRTDNQVTFRFGRFNLIYDRQLPPTKAIIPDRE